MLVQGAVNDVMNVGRILSDIARRWPNNPGLMWRDQVWSWRQLDDRVNALVAGLKSLGIGKGDRILLQSRNSNQMVETLWAAFKLGAIWVPTNFRLTPAEVAWMGESSGAVAMIYDQGFAAHVDAVRTADPALRHVIALHDARSGEIEYETLLADHVGAQAWEADVCRSDPLWFFFTSGTTGRPKAAILTHGQMAFVITNHIADLMPGLSHRDVSLAVAPLSHGAGMHMLVNTAKGAATVLLPTDRLDVGEAWRLIEHWRVTNLFTVPTIVKMLVEDPAADQFDRSSLRWIIYAGAPMYRADQKAALAKLGPILVQYFGLGEVTGNITVLPADEHSLDDAVMRIGSCGYPRTGMEIGIFAPDGQRMPAGEQGEICCRGPAVFAGYWQNPEATAKSLRGGWFHTGDLGYVDGGGYLYITGRASDMYISGGSNVYPREVEEALLTHPAISEVAVLGIPDPKWGEAGVAVLVTTAGQARPSDEALLAHLERSLSKYKWPRRFFWWDELPKSGYGKIPKHMVRDQLFARGELIKGESV